MTLSWSLVEKDSTNVVARSDGIGATKQSLLAVYTQAEEEIASLRSQRQY